MSKLRKLIRREVREVLNEQEKDYDIPWDRVMDIIYDAARNYPDVEDIGQKEIDGDTVHEFAVNNIVFQVKRLKS